MFVDPDKGFLAKPVPGPREPWLQVRFETVSKLQGGKRQDNIVY
jgi:hypothetical protein